MSGTSDHWTKYNKAVCEHLSRLLLSIRLHNVQELTNKRTGLRAYKLGSHTRFFKNGQLNFFKLHI